MASKLKRVKIVNPELNAQEGRNQEARRNANPGEFQQTELQKKAREQGVPLEAFKTPKESSQQFQERVQNAPVVGPTVTAQQVQQEADIRKEESQQNLQTIDSASRLTQEGIENVFPESIAQAQATPGIGTARSPQEFLNPGNTPGGAVRATAATLAVALPFAAASGSKIAGLGNVAGAALGVFSFGKFFDAFTKGKQAEAAEDISNAVASAKALARAAKEDPNTALEQINELESEMISAAGRLHVLYMQDPTKAISGADVEDTLRTALLQLQSYRQAVQRYRRSGNPAEIDIAVGIQATEAAI